MATVLEININEMLVSDHHVYQIVRLVGQGTFGKVYEAIDEDNRHVAIKRVEKSSNFISREVDILCSIDHENCISLLDMFYTIPDDQPERKFQNMVFDFCSHTLTTFIKARKPSLLKAKAMFHQLCSALKYLHSQNICHRDLTPNNILVDNSDDIKIADFGSAKTLEQQHVSMNYICSRFYRAPELLMGCTNYSTKIDIWSAGCILMELITGKPFFPGVDTQDQMIKIVLVLGTPSLSDLWAMKKNHKAPKFPKIQPLYFGDLLPKGTPNMEIIADLLAGMLCYNPNTRLSIDEVLAHPFFGSGIAPISAPAPASSTKMLPAALEAFDLRVQDLKIASAASSITCGAGVARV